VGLLLDAGLEAELRLRHLQVAEGCRASLGLEIGPVVTTDRPLEVSLSRGASGMSWGRLGQPGALLRAGEQLKALGATAIAVVSRFPDDDGSEALQAYRQGSGVDGLAGAEAVISHLLRGHLGLPCAHAPALAPLAPDPQLDPRAAGEELGYTFLACVLVGLSRAPDLVPLGDGPGAGAPQPGWSAAGGNLPWTSAGADRNRRAALADSGLLWPDAIGAVVAPAGALGVGPCWPASSAAFP
jgi:hypothetical protein